MIVACLMMLTDTVWMTQEWWERLCMGISTEFFLLSHHLDTWVWQKADCERLCEKYQKNIGGIYIQVTGKCYLFYTCDVVYKAQCTHWKYWHKSCHACIHKSKMQQTETSKHQLDTWTDDTHHEPPTPRTSLWSAPNPAWHVICTPYRLNNSPMSSSRCS